MFKLCSFGASVYKWLFFNAIFFQMIMILYYINKAKQ